MRLDQNPVYRKAIYPWYDSEAACYAVLAFLLFVLLFGIAGISVAGGTNGYQEYKWVPWLLVLLSGAVIISISVRLIRRYVDRFSK